MMMPGYSPQQAPISATNPPASELRPGRMITSPSLLAGEGRGGGYAATTSRYHPHPSPPPQGGREGFSVGLNLPQSLAEPRNAPAALGQRLIIRRGADAQIRTHAIGRAVHC